MGHKKNKKDILKKITIERPSWPYIMRESGKRRCDFDFFPKRGTKNLRIGFPSNLNGGYCLFDRSCQKIKMYLPFFPFLYFECV